jgi:hypothetical protein
MQVRYQAALQSDLFRVSGKVILITKAPCEGKLLLPAIFTEKQRDRMWFLMSPQQGKKFLTIY